EHRGVLGDRDVLGNELAADHGPGGSAGEDEDDAGDDGDQADGADRPGTGADGRGHGAFPSQELTYQLSGGVGAGPGALLPSSRHRLPATGSLRLGRWSRGPRSHRERPSPPSGPREPGPGTASQPAATTRRDRART